MNKKVTFATLKKLARRGELQHRVYMEYGTYGMEKVNQDQGGQKWFITTLLNHLDVFKVTKNYLRIAIDETGQVCIRLDNCCFAVYFYHQSFKSN